MIPGTMAHDEGNPGQRKGLGKVQAYSAQMAKQVVFISLVIYFIVVQGVTSPCPFPETCLLHI